MEKFAPLGINPCIPNLHLQKSSALNLLPLLLLLLLNLFALFLQSKVLLLLRKIFSLLLQLKEAALLLRQRYRRLWTLKLLARGIVTAAWTASCARNTGLIAAALPS
mmetsp:Transcript_44276/g.123132  ORF Transcript_44276/g.123132 Transcript_44276/m.123132 type:complete len:107 (-) Transcript_44276:61-381(-)